LSTAFAGRSPAASSNLRQCFPAGTLVATLAGLRPIEAIATGERVSCCCSA
jgi:hypothetical protein